MTTHNGAAHTARRQALIAMRYEVDSVEYVGPRGDRLDTLLTDSYRQEASRLVDDLGEVLANLAPADQGYAVGQIVAKVSGQLPSEVALALDELQRRLDPQNWTFDGSTGGPLGGYTPSGGVQAVPDPPAPQNGAEAVITTSDGDRVGPPITLDDAIPPDVPPPPTVHPDAVEQSSEAVAAYLAGAERFDPDQPAAKPKAQTARNRNRARGKAAAG